MLQSARVKSGFSIGANGTFNSLKSDLVLDTIIQKPYRDETNPYDTIRKTPGSAESTVFINPLYLRFGIADRVEISGSLLPYFFYGYLTGNLKIFIQEHGTPQLFHNVSYAVFGGGNAGTFERDEFLSAWAGVILSTRQIIKNSELELIFQPSYFWQRVENELLPGYEKATIQGLQVNAGAIYTLFSNNRVNLGITAGGALRRDLSNVSRIYYSDQYISEQNNAKTFSWWTVQWGLFAHFNKKPRK
jgi:hypothetical protein